MTEIEKGRLDELAEAIIAEHGAFVRTFRKAVEHGIRAGGLLTDAKGNCEHGTWLPWLKENFKSAARTAQAYMRLYDHRDEIRAKSQDSAHLSRSGAPVAQWSIGCWARSRAFLPFLPGLSHSPPRISIHRCYKAHGPGPIGPGESEGPSPVGPGLCRIRDMDFREHPF